VNLFVSFKSLSARLSAEAHKDLWWGAKLSDGHVGGRGQECAPLCASQRCGMASERSNCQWRTPRCLPEQCFAELSGGLTCQGGSGRRGGGGPRHAMMVVMELVFPWRLFVSGSDGAARQAAVCIAIGANMTSTIATRGWTFQNSLMHRQD